MHLWFDEALLPEGWVKGVRIGVMDGRITAVEQAPIVAGDERHAIGLPGLCNVHSHAFQRGMAGLSECRGAGDAADDDDFWSWREVMYRFLDRLNPDDIEAIAALAYVEMLESGYTRVGEFHYLHHDPKGRPYAALAETAVRIVAAAEIAGIGLTLLPVFYAHGDFGGAPAMPGQKRFLNDLDRFARLFDECRAVLRADDVLGIAPHSLRAVTPDQLSALLPLAGRGPVHIHAAEQVKEVDACVAHLGAPPVEWLLANMPVDARWCFIHATHLTNAEVDAMAASGAVAGLCPVTEANLGDGIFPAIRYLGAGGFFGTGTDSNILIDAAAELRQLEYSQRLAYQGRNLLADEHRPSVGRRLFDGALVGGARALGASHGIVIGASADIVSLAADHPSLTVTEGDTVLDSWIFAVGPQAIDNVWQAGRRVVRDGRHVARESVCLRYRNAMAKLVV